LRDYNLSCCHFPFQLIQGALALVPADGWQSLQDHLPQVLADVLLQQLLNLLLYLLVVLFNWLAQLLQVAHASGNGDLAVKPFVGAGPLGHLDRWRGKLLGRLELFEELVDLLHFLLDLLLGLAVRPGGFLVLDLPAEGQLVQLGLGRLQEMAFLQCLLLLVQLQVGLVD
jgi:hypothetical protein